MADEERPFVITVRRRWLLWVLPVLASLYFIAVMVIVLGNYRIRGVSTDMLVLGGLGLFALVILVELPFLLRRRAPKRKKEPKEAPPAAGEAALVGVAGANDEMMVTQESAQGLQVLEYSAPPKSQNPSAVYTKTHVPVTKSHVLRIETLVADVADI